MAVDKIVCGKCNKEKNEQDFYKNKNGDRYPMCKQCLTMHIDNKDSTTFEWILEEFDVPYIKDVWVKQYNQAYQKNPGKFGPMSVIGTYLRTMNMAQYRQYCYKDTDRLNYASDKQAQELAARREAALSDEATAQYVEELKGQLERGEISQAQFDTLNPLKDLEEQESPFAEFVKPVQIDETDILKSLSDEDMKYLAVKWGINYKPSEWVQMEDMYKQYTTEYEMNVDRAETLKQICKTTLKMNQCLDMGDFPDAQKLQAMADSLRKSAKFTEVQNKEGQGRYLDSIGELVALCEREGGIIEQFTDPDEYPQDKIDITLKDLKAYTYGLVANEFGLGELIQSYIEKLEKQAEEQEASIEDGLIISKEEEGDDPLTDEEAYEFSQFLESEFEEDVNALFAAISSEDDPDGA